ncbi:proline-specific peptidase [Hypoxylon sp. FL1150]|nr:proline-specific peptidase [Hypoxylon sp. FL1150]
MATYPTFEGTTNFRVPATGKWSITWYKIIGNLGESTTSPLIALHGGRDFDFFAPLSDIYEAHKIPTILYDQTTWGRPIRGEDRDSKPFRTYDVFIQELDNLIDHLGLRLRGFHLLGHGWGGMLAGSYAARHPRGLNRLILVSTPGSIQQWTQARRKLSRLLPWHFHLALGGHIEREPDDSQGYRRAFGVYFSQYICRLNPLPEPMQCFLWNLPGDKAVYFAVCRDWDPSKDAYEIEVQTLLVHGKHDEVSEKHMKPWYEAIKDSKWMTLNKASHTAHWEDRENFMQLCGKFLSGKPL